MANNATVSLYGTVITDPTNKQTQNGKTMLSMTCSVQTTKKSNDPKYPNQTDLYNVFVFDRFAESLIPTIKKGTKLYIVGDLQMGDPWTDRNGVTHVSPQVTATKLIVTSGGNWNNNNRSNYSAPAAAPAPQVEEEMPF